MSDGTSPAPEGDGAPSAGGASRRDAAGGGTPELGRPTVRVTVVIPARDAAATIGRAVRSVLDQRGAPPFEVVVVDNASDDGTGAVAADAGACVVRLDDRAGGPGRARNAGVGSATGSHVAFTDADCFPRPGWLAGLWAAADDAELVAGPVVADASVARGPWDRTLEYPWPTALWATANLLVAREVLRDVGGFDDWVAGAGEAPKRPFGEDTVLAWRAIRNGARTAWAPEAVVEHAVFPRDARGWILHHRDLRHMPGLVRQVPELRGELLRARVALNPATATATAALAGVLGAAALRRAVPLAAALPWFGRQAVAARSVGLRIAAVRAAGELVGAVSLAEGSLRHRTPVV